MYSPADQSLHWLNQSLYTLLVMKAFSAVKLCSILCRTDMKDKFQKVHSIDRLYPDTQHLQNSTGTAVHAPCAYDKSQIILLAGWMLFSHMNNWLVKFMNKQ